MMLSVKGIALIKRFEKCVLTAYQDQRGIWTIGWGHTGPDVYAGLVWTQAQADTQFLLDTQASIRHVTSGLTVPVSQSQFDAMVSLAYNIGDYAFLSSTLLKLVNALDFKGAAAQFLLWDHTNHVENPGLETRREAEQSLFQSL